MHPLLDLDARPVVGHRGNSAHAPENTLESFRQAVAAGADALELDVRLSRDGQVVVMHDATLDRTTGASGRVADFSAAQLHDLDAGARFSREGTLPFRDRGMGIPLLSDVLEQFPNTPLLIEIKVPEAAPAVRRVLESYEAVDRCIVAAFDARTLAVFTGSRIAVSSATAHVASVLLPAIAGRRLQELPFRTMSLPRIYRGIPLPLGAIARAVAPAGVGVHVWTVNDPRAARRLWLHGVRGILSDDPARILAARAEFNRASP